MLNTIIRRILLDEVRSFVTQSTTFKERIPSGSGKLPAKDTVLESDELVQVIRNVLWMPKGLEVHARLLLAAAGIDPENEGQREYVQGGSQKKTSDVDFLASELRRLDKHMSEHIMLQFGLLRGETSVDAVILPQALRSNTGAYSLLIRSLEAAFSSTVDTDKSMKMSMLPDAGKKAGLQTRIMSEDLVGVVIDDMIEIILSPEHEPDRIDFDRVEEVMQALVDNLSIEEDSPAAAESKLFSTFKRQIDSARSRAARQERERGARVPDATIQEMISNIMALLKLFLKHVVGGSSIPASKYGITFASMLSKACEIEGDAPLPPELANMEIGPILPEELDNGIVAFLREIHSELMDQVGAMSYLSMVYHVLTDQDDLYDKDGNPDPAFTLNNPHPAYSA
jgi:hypothetical protein